MELYVLRQRLRFQLMQKCLLRSLVIIHPSRPSPSHCNGAWIHLQRLISKAKPWAIATVENDELRLEEDVAEDGETDASVGLNATEAS